MMELSDFGRKTIETVKAFPTRIRIGAILPVKLPFKFGVAPRYETEDFGKTTPLFVDFKE